jgi:hypothetical protein
LEERDFRRQQIKRVIQNLKCYYNFFSNSISEVRSTIFSDNKSSILVNYIDVRNEVDMPVENVIEDTVVNELVDFENLKKKRKTINTFLKMTFKNDKLNQKLISSLTTTLSENFYCELCPGKIFKNKRGLNIHKAWHKKHNN